MKPKSPPNYLLNFFRWFCHPDYLEDIEGDLMERFERKAKDKGFSKAKWGFFWDVIRLFRPEIIKPIGGAYRLNYYGMIKTHLKIALRSMLRKKAFSFFNIMGLALGLASVLGIYMWVSYELSFDRFHKNADQIYQVELIRNNQERSVVTPVPLAASLASVYPDIINATKYNYLGKGTMVKVDDEHFLLEGAKTDAPFFEMFDFQFKNGSAKNFINKSIILTENTSEQLFGHKDAVGELITYKNEVYSVSAILETLPKNASFQFDFIIPFKNDELQNEDKAWGAWFCATFVQLQNQTNPEALLTNTAKFTSFYNTINKPHWSSNLIPLSQIHFDNRMTPFYNNGGSKEYVWIFSIAGIIIFFLTCTNYISLTTSRFTTHYKQIGLEKVLGAGLRNIVQKYFSESIIYTFFASLMALIILFVFQEYLFWDNGSDFLRLFYEYKALSAMVGIITSIVLITTVFPVLMFKTVNPISLLKKKTSENISGFPLRKSLVIFQFCMSICMISGTFILHDQLAFIQNKDLGYEKDNLLSIKLNEETSKNTEALYHELSHHASIKSLSRSTFESIYFDVKVSEWDGKNREKDIMIRPLTVDSSFLETFGIQLLEGRFFDKRASDNETVVINKKAAEEMGLKTPIGKKVRLPWSKGKIEIIGVINDFNYWGLTNPVEPVFMFNGGSGNLFIKMHDKQKAATISFIEKTFRKLNPTYPLEYSFMTERYNQQHIYHQRTGKIFSYFGVISIVISCLSLLAMVLFTTEQRTKEIGIRKVNGASVEQIIQLLTKDYLWMWIVAFLIAVPCSWLAMEKWLEIFSYRIDISFGHYLLGGVLAVLAGFFTIIFQTVKAALTNPIKTLKDE